MSKRNWTTRPTRVSLLLTTLLLPAMAACDSSSGGGAPSEPDKPGVEPDPGTASSLPPAPALNVNAAANDATRAFPLDATPSPDGKTIYYIAISKDAAGDPLASVFRTTAEGGGEVSTVASGAPLASPVGITTSLDGATLYVADPGSEGAGAILSIPEGGGAAAALAGTAGYRPQGITLAEVDKKPTLYFTGYDPASGAAGVFSLAPSGGQVTALAMGSPFASPGGVTVLKSGDVYVADSAAENGSAAIIKVKDGTASSFVARIGVGFPAGITSTQDGSTILVSGLDPATRTDVVYFVDAASGDLSALTDTINAFSSPAGVHRAHDTNVFAWADSRANFTGTVYVLAP